MTIQVHFLPEATAELEHSIRWYEERHRGLGLAFLAAVDGTIESIVRWPGSGAPVTGVAGDLEVRRARVGRFPYHLVYLMDHDRIHVLAVAHDGRRPGYWHARTEP
ncbi:MAG TPA: type II toxin-antitoxin system RelE/ParE family toxin [Acidimicrobiales bacterium]|nr:type II toxin-antitoxin system RelE/ParE family toxin [Acidimicrobiales bacterium]